MSSKKTRQLKDDAIYSVSQIAVRKVPENAAVKVKSPYAEIGEDVYFYVSGTIDGKPNVDRRVAVFGGDVVISGSLRVEGCELTGSFNFDCDILELTGTIDVHGNGKFTEGVSTSEIKTLSGDPFFASGAGINLSSDPSTGQITISSTLVWNEKLLGDVDGVNTNFSTSYSLSSSETLMVFVNGVLQEAGEESDFIVSGNTITFNTPPTINSKIIATYTKI